MKVVYLQVLVLLILLTIFVYTSTTDSMRHNVIGAEPESVFIPPVDFGDIVIEGDRVYSSPEGMKPKEYLRKYEGLSRWDGFRFPKTYGGQKLAIVNPSVGQIKVNNLKYRTYKHRYEVDAGRILLTAEKNLDLHMDWNFERKVEMKDGHSAYINSYDKGVTVSYRDRDCFYVLYFEGSAIEDDKIIKMVASSFE